MIVNRRWLEKYVNLSGWSDHQLENKLAVSGHEVEHHQDELFDVKITPNRGDCLSIYGLARDIAGVYNRKLTDFETLELPKPSQFYNLTVDHSAKDYVISDGLVKLTNYHHQQSPREVTNILGSFGVTAKDLMIDLSNFVSYELGLPLHVFDFDSVSKGMICRLSIKSDRSISLLNGETVPLASGCLIQESDGRLVDFAGVMGGQLSCVNDQTKTVLLQAAVFDPRIVRKNSKSVNLITEASYRYERSVDPNLVKIALKRFLFLLKKYAPEVTIENYQHYNGNDIQERKIAFDKKFIENLLGIQISKENIHQLEKLGFKITADVVSVPTWRTDVQSLADIADELLRIVGLDKITKHELKPTKQIKSEEFELRRQLTQILYSQGLSEAVTSTLWPDGGKLSVIKAASALEKDLRSDLLSGLLKISSKNQYLGKSQFFEIGNVFLPEEKTHLGIMLFGYKDKQTQTISNSIQEMIKFPGSMKFNRVETNKLAEYEIKQSNVWYWEGDLTYLKPKIYLTIQLVATPKPINPISKFPPIVRDVTLLVDEDLDRANLLKAIGDIDKAILTELVAQYRSDTFEKGKVALTYRIFFQDLERNLTDKEIDVIFKDHFQKLSKKLKFVIR